MDLNHATADLLSIYSVVLYKKISFPASVNLKARKKKLTKVCLLASGPENFGSQKGRDSIITS